MGTRTSPRSYTPRCSTDSVGKTPISHFLRGRCLTQRFPSCCLRITSNQPVFRHWTRSSPPARCQVLAYLQLLWATKNKEGILNSNKGCKDIQELRVCWLTRLMSHRRPFCQELEWWLFHLKHRNHHRESKKKKKQRNVFQTQEPKINLQKLILIEQT